MQIVKSMIHNKSGVGFASWSYIETRKKNGDTHYAETQEHDSYKKWRT